MKRLAIIFVATLITSSVIAQEVRMRFSAEDIANKLTEQMVTTLSLTNEQKDSVAAINLKYATQQGEIFRNQAMEREARRAEIRKLQEEKNAEIKQILTEEQYAKYLESANNPRNREGRGGRNGGGGRNGR
jgi:Spy/CpxP family protein refolding chaperone